MHVPAAVGGRAGAPRGARAAGFARAPPTVPIAGDAPPRGAAIRRRDAQAVRAPWNKHAIEQYITEEIY